MCSSEKCRGGPEYTDTIKAHQSIQENIASNGIVQPFRIETGNGRILGCLPAVSNRYEKGLVIRLSRMTPRPGRVIHVG